MNNKYEMTSMPPGRNLHNHSIVDGKTIRCRENPKDKGIKRARSRNTRPGLVCALNIFYASIFQGSLKLRIFRDFVR